MTDAPLTPPNDPALDALYEIVGPAISDRWPNLAPFGHEAVDRVAAAVLASGYRPPSNEHDEMIVWNDGEGAVVAVWHDPSATWTVVGSNHLYGSIDEIIAAYPTAAAWRPLNRMPQPVPVPTLRDIHLGKTMTLAGEVRAMDLSNGRAADDPAFAYLPDGQVRVTLLVQVESHGGIPEDGATS